MCPGLNLHKMRRSGPAPFPQPSLKIKRAHSLATAKLHTCQAALLIQPDNARLLLRAKAPTRPPDHFILDFHPRTISKLAFPAYLALPAFACADTIRRSARAQVIGQRSQFPAFRVQFAWAFSRPWGRPRSAVPKFFSPVIRSC